MVAAVEVEVLRTSSSDALRMTILLISAARREVMAAPLALARSRPGLDKAIPESCPGKASISQFFAKHNILLRIVEFQQDLPCSA